MKKIFAIALTSIALMLTGFATSCGDNNPHEPTYKDFENVFFDNKTVTYDGESHILDEVRGAPEGTDITYTGRESHIDAGTYVASALLTKDGYNNKTLTATLTINKTTFENITFSDGTFEYDGSAHSIYVSGVPSFATVKYSNNNKVNVGVYNVTATITATNYETMTRTATLRITGKQITGITLEDASFQYDGQPHSLEVTGELPSGVSVSYTNNGKTDSGTYKVSATLSGTGYDSLTLTATLTITPIELSKSGYFLSRAYLYDGQNHSVYVDSAPSGLTISYKCLNASGTNTFKDIGVYEVEATIKSDINHLSKKYATLTITTPASMSVDSSKTPLTIDDNLKWDQLHGALGNGNFTLKNISGSYDVEKVDDEAPANLLDDTFEGHTSGYIFASDGKDAYQHSYSLNKPDVSNYYHYYKEQGNDIIHLEFNDDTNTGNITKFPKQAFKETITYDFASDVFVALTKGENGEFLPGVDGDDSYNNVGIPYIGDGIFTVLMEHPHSQPLSNGYTRYFYEILKVYNIGNTIVDIPTNYIPSQNYIDNKAGVDTFYLGGVQYCMANFGSATKGYYLFSAQLYVDYHRSIFLEAGTYTVLPIIYNRVVKAIVYSRSFYVYNTNQSGYNFRLFVNSSGVYQGEYSDLGTLERFNINEFISKGGTVEYYEDWYSLL